MEDISCQNDIYDWLLAVTPIIISASVAAIGYFQFQVNRSKLKLDLYNRRFSVYEKSVKYYQTYYSKNSSKEHEEETASEFIRAYRESIFLFGENSEVFSELENLKNNLGYRFQLQEARRSDPDNKDRIKSLQEIIEKQIEPELILKALEKSLKPWLNLSKVERKYFV